MLESKLGLGMPCLVQDGEEELGVCLQKNRKHGLNEPSVSCIPEAPVFPPCTGYVELSFSQQNYPHPLLLPCSKPGMGLELCDGFSSARLGTVVKPGKKQKLNLCPSIPPCTNCTCHKRAGYFCRKCGQNPQFSLER